KDKFGGILEVVVSKLHEDKDYKSIIEVCGYFSEAFLEKANVLFELAFAYNENENKINAKKFYQKIWKKKQKSSAVANNLALLYEEEDDWIHAEELFKKAVELDPDDEISQSNLQRFSKKVEDNIKDIQRFDKEQKNGLENIKNEDIYIYQRLSYLMDAEDEKKYIVATYKQLTVILKASPEKVQEIIKSFLKKNYIIKVKNHDINTFSNVYRLNHLVRKYIIKNKKRIEKNKLLSIIGERINIDSLDDLGYDDNLLSEIDLKIS
ncbi:unnamed protein product, partial [marine sediment metagenome]